MPDCAAVELEDVLEDLVERADRGHHQIWRYQVGAAVIVS